MKVYPDKPEETDNQPVDKMVDFTQTSYRQFSDYVAFRDNDPLWMLAYKLILRFIGIVFMIMISPIVLVGLIVAVAIAS